MIIEAHEVLIAFQFRQGHQLPPLGTLYGGGWRRYGELGTGAVPMMEDGCGERPEIGLSSLKSMLSAGLLCLPLRTSL